MPHVVNVVGLQQNARLIACSRYGGLNFVAFDFLEEEVERRNPKDDRRHEREDGKACEVFTMDDFHNDVIDEVQSQVAHQNEQKMIGKRFRLRRNTVDSEGHVHTVRQ